MKISFFWLCIIVVFLCSGCAPGESPSAGIRVTDSTVAVGGVGGGADRQVVSYQITLHNPTKNEITVRWVEPVLNEGISDKLVGDNTRFTVDKTIGPNSSLTIASQFIFDSSGLTKSQIADLSPYIKDILISAELELPLRPQAGE